MYYVIPNWKYPSSKSDLVQYYNKDFNYTFIWEKISNPSFEKKSSLRLWLFPNTIELPTTKPYYTPTVENVWLLYNNITLPSSPIWSMPRDQFRVKCHVNPRINSTVQRHQVKTPFEIHTHNWKEKIINSILFWFTLLHFTFTKPISYFMYYVYLCLMLT